MVYQRLSFRPYFIWTIYNRNVVNIFYADINVLLFADDFKLFLIIKTIKDCICVQINYKRNKRNKRQIHKLKRLLKNNNKSHSIRFNKINQPIT